MDKYPDSYQVVESAKIAPLSENEVILIVNNTEPQKNRYLKNILRYLRIRGIEHVVASSVDEIKKAYETKKGRLTMSHRAFDELIAEQGFEKKRQSKNGRKRT